jgi:farnesyl diphosphate synthase
MTVQDESATSTATHGVNLTDAAAGKATMVSILGVAGAKARLHELVAGAEDALAPFGTAGTTLVTAARFIADRRS